MFDPKRDSSEEMVEPFVLTDIPTEEKPTKLEYTSLENGSQSDNVFPLLLSDRQLGGETMNVPLGEEPEKEEYIVESFHSEEQDIKSRQSR